MIKEDNEDFQNSTKCLICCNNYIDNEVKVRDHCHITGKYGNSVDRDFNINIKLNYKIPMVFHYLKKLMILILLCKNYIQLSKKKYMSDFKKFKKDLSCKEKFYSLLTERKISDKENDQFLKVWSKFK